MAFSDQLTTLAGKTKNLEDSASAVRDRNREALRARHEQLVADLAGAKQRTDSAMAQSKSDANAAWAAFKNSIDERFASIQEKHKQSKARNAADNAEREAENAEEYAEYAIDWAIHAIQQAEYAVVDAALARADADLAANSAADTD